MLFKSFHALLVFAMILGSSVDRLGLNKIVFALSSSEAHEFPLTKCTANFRCMGHRTTSYKANVVDCMKECAETDWCKTTTFWRQSADQGMYGLFDAGYYCEFGHRNWITCY